MRMYTMCRHCGRALAGTNGLCRLCLLRRVTARRLQVKHSTKIRR